MKKLIKFLKNKFPKRIQMFNTRNNVGDRMFTIYHEDGITVYYCPDYDYIEIFGLTDKQFEKVKNVQGF